ncbi:MAG: polyphosphate kinase [Candidatus Methanolliviera sp. GoM_asphalt]|nr:MAG: polyphosphate kinase [Candidatus Methanolliviera sp. GoM_asphalt]
MIETNKKTEKIDTIDKGISLDDPNLYINRELSWIKLNERIFEEANDKTHPLLERVKFLAICGSNLDEFFMVRVSGLKRQLLKGALKVPPDGMTPQEQLTAIEEEIRPLLKEYEKCWKELVPSLSNEGIKIEKVSDLETDQRLFVKKYFESKIFPTLTPLAMDIAHPFPFISNLSQNLAIIIKDPEKGEKYARIKIPSDIFPRFIEIPNKEYPMSKSKLKKTITLVFLEDIIASHIDALFPGLQIAATYPFRITRNAEMKISLDKASDLLIAIEEGVEFRRTGFPIRLETDKSIPDKLMNLFVRNFGLTNDFVYRFDGPLGLVDLWEIHDIDRPDLRDSPFLPYTPPAFAKDQNVFAAIDKRDWILYSPYDNFNILVNLLMQAAEDPNVLAIKATMYRIAKKSPIIDALKHARENGKVVAVIVELKAKFDEETNINCAKDLEEDGVHVVYGLEDLKIHAKICLIVKKKGNDIVRYSYISTGNLNVDTMGIYADITYLTANPEIGEEITEVFNFFTGYSRKDDYKHLIVAPMTLRKEIMRRINREIECHKKTEDGYIALKLNSLVDEGIIKALYRASIAGVKIDLNVRGLCSLRPNIKGVSEKINVTSIIGRFLEHARIYYFRNGGEEDVLIGSADMMYRNLNRRVEVLLDVPDPKIKTAIIKNMLNIHLKDNVKARRLLPDGTYERVTQTSDSDEERLNSQIWLTENRGIWHDEK